MEMIISSSAEDTYNAGAKIALYLKPNDVIALIGDVGAGKTVFTKGIAKGLDINEVVSSPTFTLLKEYDGRFKLCHFDVYRITDVDEMFETGFFEHMENDGVIVVEWADIIDEILPKKHIKISIEKTGDNERIINIEKIDREII